MGTLFDIYDALARSGLFDPDFYCAHHPEIAAANVDPLIHYIEEGARRGLSPHAEFDVAYYLEQCAVLGERPENPLLHYLTVGTGRGLKHKRGATAQDAAAGASTDGLMLFIDAPRLGDGAGAIKIDGGLSLAGWALARRGVATIDVAIDGVRLVAARCGIERRDVLAAYPDWNDALHSGFAAAVPSRHLAPGVHAVVVALRDRAGHETRIAFEIDVADGAGEAGPGALRRKMNGAEIDLDRQILAALGWRPRFRVAVLADGKRGGRERLRATLETLLRQAYEDCEVLVVPPGRARDHSMLEGFDDFAGRVRIAPSPALGAVTKAAVLVIVLRAGDRLAVDALMELALAAAANRGAEFLYGDERRRDFGTAPQPFYKPDWSPDLLLSMNYIGRFWCAAPRLLARAGVDIAGLRARGDYDAVLRLTEAARAVGHVPSILGESAPRSGDSAAQERDALAAALARRGIAARPVAGGIAGMHRVRRTIAQREIVSVIIAADRAPDRVEACIEALRGRTGCRGDEIICVGNFSGRSAAARRRLDRAADRVLDGREHATWADACNRAAAAARGEYLLFLDPGIEILDPDWLDQLVARARSAEIGAVGPRLLDPARRIRDGGLFVTPASEVRAAFRGSSEDEPGYFGLAQAERNVIAVNGACLLTRRANFAAVDGFVVYPSAVESALDYGLRLRQRGLFNLHMPHVRLVLHADPEPDAVAASAMLARRWRKVFVGGDPYFHPRLAPASDGMTPEREPAERIACGHPVLANDKVKRILAVKLDHLGDCVTVLPALRRLKQHFPAARLAVLSGPWARDVWALEPAIDEVIEFSYYFAQSGLGARTVSDGEREKLRRRLRPYRFDLAVDLRKIPDTRPILQLAGARCLAGFEFGGRFPWLDIALEWEPDRALVQKRQHISDDFINLVDAVGAACAPDRHVIVGPAPPVSARVGRLPKSLFTRPLVCVHPAAGGALRQWPPTHFAALIDLLVERQGVNIALIGHGDDRSVTNAVRAKVELKRNVFSLAGKLALADLPALLARAVLFVGNDSGPKHLAAGLGVPTIGIQSGAVDSVEWGPLGPYALAVRRDMACAPCYLQRPEDCPREIACLAGLAVGDVYRACERLLALGRARALNSTAGKPHDMRRSLKRRARHH